MSDKRQFRRFPVYQSTFFKTSNPDEVFECLVHDLSISGILIESGYHLAEDDIITVAIRYGKKTFSEEIKIVRQMRLITLRFGGIFLSENNVDARREYLQSIEKQESL